MTSGTIANSTLSQPVPRVHLDLFLISFVVLFFELVCVRWFGSTVIFLTFFTNWVLLACTLGMSVGCLTSQGRRQLINFSMPLTLTAVILAYAILYTHQSLDQFGVDVGDQAKPQEVFFGTEYRLGNASRFLIPIELIAGLFYVLIALIFLGPGQILGRALGVIPDRTAAYTTNILGSLAGVAAFTLASWLRLPPVLWFTPVSAIFLYFIRNWKLRTLITQLGSATIILIALSMDGHSEEQTIWSPYYKISYNPQSASVSTNNIIHQWIIDVEESGPEYNLPYLLNRDAGGRPFGNVLIIGSGTGNDVQAALRHGASHVDAVEVDPVLFELGRDTHPGRPYDDPRVTVYLDDGRNFLRRTNRRYDLVVYALVDSLVLHSGYSNLRLESFLFTEQAFRDVQSRLKPGGVFAMYNYYRWGWVVGRLDAMAVKVFGAKPAILPLNSGGTIRPEDNNGGITLLLAGSSECSALNGIRESFRRSGSFWTHRRPIESERLNGFERNESNITIQNMNGWQKIEMARVEAIGMDRLPSDNWPFLYLRSPMIPALYIRGMLLVAALSLAVLYLFAPDHRPRVEGRMFFLGAGFMLLETRGVTQMALVFGSTWLVSSIVLAAVLIMSLAANLYVKTFRPSNMKLYFFMIASSMLINYTIDIDSYLGIPFALRAILACAVVFSPVAFAGVIFASAFHKSLRPEAALGANVAGILLGGISEYGVLVLGFDWLLLVAFIFYAMAMFPWQSLRLGFPSS